MDCQDCRSCGGDCQDEVSHAAAALRVLFIEDSEDDKELLLAALNDEFPSIVHARAESAIQLRRALEHQTWDLILCDHGLPALDAPAALRIAQEYGSDAPFIVVSGSMTEETAVATMRAGAVDMISKGQLARLVPTVRRELRKSTEMVDLRRAQAHLRHLACYDEQTGLPKREYLAQKMEGLIGAGYLEQLALVVVNISRFALIPRTLGLAAADEALCLVGERLLKSVGTSGIVGSLGGDRFAILLTGRAANADPAAWLERISEDCARPLKVAGQELFLGLRIGVALYPDHGREFQELLVNAETAMSHVSAGSQCNFDFFEPGMRATGRNRWAMEQALYRAVQQNEFALHYQPQIDTRSGRIVGVEALLRWPQADGTAISPAEFIPLLEETGLIVPVGEWVLRAACLQNLAWQRAGHAPIRVAVNLSAIQFRQAGLVAMVRRVLDETGMDRRYLELEITENVAMHNEESVIATLAELRAMGVGLAIDDFGTGYCSLGYLRRFPVHKLKIDQTFVHDITESEPDSPIVKAIASLAGNLGLSLIAEGVETERQADFLAGCGCPEMQGFLFSRPQPAGAIESQLLAGASAHA